MGTRAGLQCERGAQLLCARIHFSLCCTHSCTYKCVCIYIYACTFILRVLIYTPLHTFIQ